MLFTVTLLHNLLESKNDRLNLNPAVQAWLTMSIQDDQQLQRPPISLKNSIKWYLMIVDSN